MVIALHWAPVSTWKCGWLRSQTQVLVRSTTVCLQAYIAFCMVGMQLLRRLHNAYKGFEFSLQVRVAQFPSCTSAKLQLLLKPFLNFLTIQCLTKNEVHSSQQMSVCCDWVFCNLQNVCSGYKTDCCKHIHVEHFICIITNGFDESPSVSVPTTKTLGFKSLACGICCKLCNMLDINLSDGICACSCMQFLSVFAIRWFV